MTEKKKPEVEEELEEDQAEAVATPENASSEVEQLSAEAERASLKKQLAEAESRDIRLQG